MDDNQLCAAMTRIVAAGIVLAIMSMAGCVASREFTQTNAMADMVKSGADPLAVRCAINSSSADQLCTVLAARK